MKNSSLRILMTVDPEIPVPPSYYGGIERIVYLLICALTTRGHEVHLFAHPESKTPAKLICYRGKRSGSLVDTALNALQIRNYIGKMGKVDIIHSFSRLAYLSLLMKTSIPKIQSYQRHITQRSIFLGTILGGETLTFTACSKYCASTANFSDTQLIIIPNGVPLAKYRFNANVPSDAPLVFLGRLERIKGAHTAIEVAKKSGRRLIIAGNHDAFGANYRYFIDEVLPQCDGKMIQYVGQVNDIQKNELLGNSAALLFPVEWDEPFGIVMVEALACGTPVIAFGRGAVGEVIKHRETGFICNTIDEMVDAVRNITFIERLGCRTLTEKYFSDTVIVEKYEQLYNSCIKKEKL